MWWTGIYLFSLFLRYITCQNPEVVTNIGVIRGLRATDGDYNMFMGIPYAYVNESNPFGVSIPAEPFDEVFEAYDDSAICPQIEEFNNTLVGTLDCMHLNIYVPSTASIENPLPVLTYIYGGYFMIGFAGRYVYGPKYLVRHDIIVVTLNYRLGPYGFMCLGTPEIPGNQGLRDQVTALRWIRDNIAAFGGDPEKVTVAGNSAGGMSTAFHVMSDIELLFDKVIVQSGPAPHFLVEPNLNYPIKLAAQTGFNTNDINEALDHLKSLSTDTVTIAAFSLGHSYIVPCSEKDIEGVERFILSYKYNSKMPKAKNISAIVGYNSDEAYGLVFNETQEFFDSFSFKRFLNIFDLEEAEADNLAEIMKQFYVGDNTLTSDFKQEVADAASDFRFVYPSELLIDKLIDNNIPKIYRYMFSYSGGRNFGKIVNGITEGEALHADEIGYLFDVSFIREGQTSEQDQLVTERFAAMVANFVKFGDPTPEQSELLPVKWLPLAPDASHTIYIGSDLTTGMRPFHERQAFWHLIYEMYGDRVGDNWDFQIIHLRSGNPQLSPFLIHLVLLTIHFRNDLVIPMRIIEY